MCVGAVFFQGIISTPLRNDLSAKYLYTLFVGNTIHFFKRLFVVTKKEEKGMITEETVFCDTNKSEILFVATQQKYRVA